tara:strand:+ start:748 stop:1119 length:372 start_codon:yes stop_codon:yes gene_type:complete
VATEAAVAAVAVVVEKVAAAMVVSDSARAAARVEARVAAEAQATAAVTQGAAMRMAENAVQTPLALRRLATSTTILAARLWEAHVRAVSTEGVVAPMTMFRPLMGGVPPSRQLSTMLRAHPPE